MITAIRSNNFRNSQYYSIKQQNQTNYSPKANQGDSVSFSGSEKELVKLSEASNELVQKFAQKLKVNKMYKFDTPNVEHFQLASVASRKNPETRHLYVQYSAYSDDNSAKYIMFSVNNSGEVYESGNKVKNKKEIAIYETILPQIINKASKELKINLKS